MLGPKFFSTREAFRRWLAEHHASARELWVGFHKKSSGRPSISWPESVDEALCFGWIDGLRKSIDGESYAIRFTPRRPSSGWSAVNISRAKALIAQGRMTAAGLKAFKARDPKARPSSVKDRPHQLPPKYLRLLKREEAAWAFFQSRPPSYRRAAAFWIVNAKKEDTSLRRLHALVTHSSRQELVPTLVIPRKKPGSQ